MVFSVVLRSSERFKRRDVDLLVMFGIGVGVGRGYIFVEVFVIFVIIIWYYRLLGI